VSRSQVSVTATDDCSTVSEVRTVQLVAASGFPATSSIAEDSDSVYDWPGISGAFGVNVAVVVGPPPFGVTSPATAVDVPAILAVNVVSSTPTTGSEKVTVNAPVIEALDVGVLLTTVGAAASIENDRLSDVPSVLPPASSRRTRQV
jgi:hypothetical protein